MPDLPSDLAVAAGAPPSVVGIDDPTTQSSREVPGTLAPSAAPNATPTATSPAPAKPGEEPPISFRDIMNFDVTDFVPPELYQQMRKQATDRMSLGEVFALSGLASVNPDLAHRLYSDDQNQRHQALQFLTGLANQQGLAKRSMMQYQLQIQKQQEMMAQRQKELDQKQEEAARGQRRMQAAQVRNEGMIKYGVNAAPPTEADLANDDTFAQWYERANAPIAQAAAQQAAENEVLRLTQVAAQTGTDLSPQIMQVWKRAGVDAAKPENKYILDQVRQSAQLGRQQEQLRITSANQRNAAITESIQTSKANRDLIAARINAMEQGKTSASTGDLYKDFTNLNNSILAQGKQLETLYMNYADETNAEEKKRIGNSITTLQADIVASRNVMERIQRRMQDRTSAVRNEISVTLSQELASRGVAYEALDNNTQQSIMAKVLAKAAYDNGMPLDELKQALFDPAMQSAITRYTHQQSYYPTEAVTQGAGALMSGMQANAASAPQAQPQAATPDASGEDR